MIEESREQSPQTNESADAGSSDDMAAALEDMKSSSPSMGTAIDSAGITPDKLAESRGRSTPGEHEAAQPATEEGNQG